MRKNSLHFVFFFLFFLLCDLFIHLFLPSLEERMLHNIHNNRFIIIALRGQQTLTIIYK